MGFGGSTNVSNNLTLCGKKHAFDFIDVYLILMLKKHLRELRLQRLLRFFDSCVVAGLLKN